MTKKILIIDDEEAIRKSFLLSLEDTDYTVETAESGEIGIQKRREAIFDLIFLDLKMPGINGVETLFELRKIDQNVPIYIVTYIGKMLVNLTCFWINGSFCGKVCGKHFCKFLFVIGVNGYFINNLDKKTRKFLTG